MTTARKLRIEAVGDVNDARGRGVGNIRMHSDIGIIRMQSDIRGILIYSDYV